MRKARKMNAESTKLYADTVDDFPLLEIEIETLSDGSKVWNLRWRNVVIPCLSEAHAIRAFMGIAHSLQEATNENITTI